MGTDAILRLKSTVRKLGNPKRGKFSRRFFKTGKGEYAEGDLFYGLSVPECRKIASEFRALTISETQRLLRSPIHEERLIALFILIDLYHRGDKKSRKRIYDLYLKSTQYINNWDLVDSSAYKIVGHYLLDKPRSELGRLAKSNDLWERRIAIIATLTFISEGQFDDTLRLSRILLKDSHDLIHKAVGWMLRELGKQSPPTLEKFLDQNYHRMPRTMLRYAIERLPEKKRKEYLKIIKR